ncbi:MAG: hypothetical protein AB7Q42_16170 [Acidimicrobiia bacterium]
MRSSSTVDPQREDPVRFQGATLEEAVATARAALGPRARVVEANRIRRGGIGGFFATDLGVEVAVLLEDESMDAALERLVAQSSAADGLEPAAGRGTVVPAMPNDDAPQAAFAGVLAREMFAEMAPAETASRTAVPHPAPAQPELVPEPEPELMSPAASYDVQPIRVLSTPSVELDAEARAAAAEKAAHRSRTRSPRRTIEPAPVDDGILITAEDILAELEMLAAEALLIETTEPAPQARPRSASRIRRHSSTRRRATAPAPEVLAELLESLEAPGSEVDEFDPFEPVADVATEAEAITPVDETTLLAAAGADAVELPATKPVAPRARRRASVRKQVELAIEAANNLVQRVSDSVDGAPQITVKIVVSTSDGNHVEAEAQLGGQ